METLPRLRMASVRFLLTEVHVDKSKLGSITPPQSLLWFPPLVSCLEFLSGLPLLMCKLNKPLFSRVAFDHDVSYNDSKQAKSPGSLGKAHISGALW